jgi:hypothetical protein
MGRREYVWLPLALCLGVTERADADSCGAREVVEVSDVAGLLANIGRDHVDVRLAPGPYVLADCRRSADEWSASDCGQLRQGDCSILSSDLQLAADANGVPVSSGTIFPSCGSIPTGGVGEGAVIDCGA